MEHNLLKLDGRIIVVSGAAGGGIGTTVTRLVARAGATVIAVSRSQANLDRHIAPLVSQGLSITPVAADAQTEEGVAAVMERVRGARGDLYGLVNVAGGAAPSTWGRSTRLSRADWHALFSQNLDSMFFMSQAVAAELRGAGTRGLAGLDLLNQRRELGAFPCWLWRGQGRDVGGGPNDGARAGPGRYPGQRRGAGADRDARVAHIY